MKIVARITLLTLMAMIACETLPEEPEFDNPIIPDDPTYEPPQTTIISGPAEGAVVDTHSVTFIWAGNQVDMEFTYCLDGGDWSAWSVDTSVTYTYQDEGDYLFEVMGRYLSGIEEETAVSRYYTIDDIHGPALWLQPRYQEVDQGGTFAIEVMLEEVENIFAVKAVLEYDTAKLQVSQIEVYEDSRSLLKSNGGTVIPFSSFDNSAGNVTIEVATATGSPPGVSGTGSVGRITLSAIQTGQGMIAFSGASELRDPENSIVELLEKVPVMVEVR